MFDSFNNVANCSIELILCILLKLGELLSDLNGIYKSPNDMFGIGYYSLFEASDIDAMMSLSKELVFFRILKLGLSK